MVVKRPQIEDDSRFRNMTLVGQIRGDFCAGICLLLPENNPFAQRGSDPKSDESGDPETAVFALLGSLP